MTMTIWQFVALLAAFAVFVGLTYWRGYRNGYRAASMPVAGSMAMGAYSGQHTPVPDYEDGSPMP
jgi:hypothetical protein